MRLVEQIVGGELLKPKAERLAALTEWLTSEIEDALSARQTQETVWREMLRLYEGVPKNPVRNVPIENAPNLVITLCAIASDAIYAQALDLIYTASPTVTVRATNEDYTEHAKALQPFVTWGTANEWGLRQSSEHMLLDDVQLGTGVYFVPFVENKKKTKVNRVVNRGSKILSVPPEDFLVPGGADADLQTARWCALRTWLNDGELREEAASLKWDTEGVMPAGVVGWVRSQRETLGRTSSSKRISELYEIFRVYCYFDIDGDGLEEDLLIVWDRSSRKVLKVVYNPFDRRPFEAARYQLRAHLFYGIGVIEMLRMFQEGVTELYNHWTLNSMLANSRLWKARRGQVPENMKLWPNRVIELDDPSSLIGEQLGDTYSSAPQSIAVTISLAERRAGVNELSLPRPSQVLGSRTPGITALSLLQQVNRRFTPAFDGMRLATAGAVRQCLYRYQERLLAGDAEAEAHILKVLGPAGGRLVVDVLKREDFDEAIAIELTASSASVNREADRQNAIMLVNILAQYYQRVLELVGIASNPQVTPAVKSVAMKIAEAAGAIIERTVRTFDQIRDPQTFVVQVEEEINGMEGLSQTGLGGLGRLLGLLTGPQGAGAGNGAPGPDVGAGA